MNPVRKVLAIIPARSGSKGLPNKNLALLKGKPLIQWSLEAAQNSDICDRIVLATDGVQIRDMGKSLGAEVITLPEEVTRDDSPMHVAVDFVLESLAQSGYRPEWILLLQPTSPLRTRDHIREAVLHLTEGDKGVISVCPVSNKWLKALTLDKRGHLRGLGGEDRFTTTPRAQLPELFLPNGAIYLMRTDTYLSCGDLFCDGALRPYVMDPSSSVDIDTEADLSRAEDQVTNTGL